VAAVLGGEVVGAEDASAVGQNLLGLETDRDDNIVGGGEVRVERVGLIVRAGRVGALAKLSRTGSGGTGCANFAAAIEVSAMPWTSAARCAASDGRSAGFFASSANSSGQHDMAAHLATAEGKQLYARRGALVEPGFAQLFQKFGRRLHHRGTIDVNAEIKLLGAVHNMNKIFRHDAKQRTS